MELVGLSDVEEAATRLEGVSLTTPMEHSWALSELAGGTTYLKCENLQRTGAFKIRGAYNRIAKLDATERARGVVTASAGNHGQGVALAASLLGIKATVFMPKGAQLPKVEAARRYGADVVLEGSVYDDAFEACSGFAKAEGAVVVHPFDHRDVIAGQGTISLEILKQVPDVSSIVVPVGGGGLISGVAAAAKAIRSDIRVIGVEPEGAATLSRALEFGRLVTLDTLSTVADGLAAKRAGEITLAHAQMFVEEIVTVSEEELAEGLLLVAERAKLVVEPAGAAAVAALMNRRAKVEFPAVAILSGGNIDPLVLMKVIRFGMGAAGRYFSFRTRVSDHPGQLYSLLGVLADAGANVIGIEHHRESRLQHLAEVEIAVQVETRGPDHVRVVERRLEEAGYKLEKL